MIAKATLSADRRLQQRIRDALSAKHFRELQRVQVEVDEQSVTLRGRVSSFYERQLCISVCRRVKEIKSLTDRLEVGPVSSTAVGSLTVQDKVHRARLAP